MYASDIADLLHLVGRRVCIRSGKRTFVGVLRSAATRKFPKGKNLHASGLVLEGPDSELNSLGGNGTCARQRMCLV
jgi:hypothetical protein